MAREHAIKQENQSPKSCGWKTAWRKRDSSLVSDGWNIKPDITIGSFKHLIR